MNNNALPVLALIVGQMPVGVSAGVFEPIVLRGHEKTYAWETGGVLTPSSTYRLGGHDYTRVIERRDKYFRHSGRFELRAVSGMVDWHPLGGHFRLTAGLFIKAGRLNFLSGPEVAYEYPNAVLQIDTSDLPEAIRIPGGTFRSPRLRDLGLPGEIEYGGASIPLDVSAIPGSIMIPAGRIEIDRSDFGVAGSVSLSPVSPYLGLGWGSRPGSGERWRYSIDVGLLYHSRATLKAGLSGRIAEADAKLGGIISYALKRRVDAVQPELDAPVLLPYVSLGLSVAL